tara:strand:+ start:401 stop:1627 length:1227 start_codon:yes stop_codon:yes gene_type:complete
MTIDCKFCSTKLNEVISFGKMPIANAFLEKKEIENEFFFELASMYCPSCFLFQLKEQPKPEKLFHENYAFFAGTSNVMQNHFSDLSLELINRFSLSKEDLVIEIGNNDGGMVKYLNDLGFKNHIGIDPSSNVANQARKQGVNMVCDFFSLQLAETIKDKYGKARYFLAANTLAHIPDINSVFEGISNLLHDEGIFITEDPYQVDLFQKTSYDQIYDEHVFIFSLTSMINICKKFNLKVFDVKYIPTAGGSLRYYISKNKNIPITDSLKNHLEIEKIINFKSELTYKNFFINCEISKKNLIESIENLLNTKKTIASYGATSKSTTIFNYCNISSAEISYITDTTPTKQNKLSPGTHIPVYDYDFFNKNLPDVCFLGAWNHKDEIFKKERKNFNTKGKWISHLNDLDLSV